MKASRLSVHPNFINAELVRILLMDDGLHPLPLQPSSYITLTGSEMGFWVFVPEPELERAKACLRGTPYEKTIWDNDEPTTDLE